MRSQSTSSPLALYLICFAAALFPFYAFFQMSMFNVMGPILMEYFSVSPEKLGVLSASYLIADALLMLPVGLLLDRYPVRKLILVGLAIMVLSTFVITLSTHFALTLTARFLTGAAHAFALLSCFKLISQWFSTEKAGLLMGLTLTIAFIGSSISQAPLNALIELVGWKNALFVNVGVGVIIFAILYHCLVTLPQKNSFSHTAFSFSSYWKDVTLAAKNVQNWLSGLYVALLSLPIMLFAALWGYSYLLHAHGLSSSQAATASGMIFISSIIGFSACGWISDHLRQRKRPMILGSLSSCFLAMCIFYVPNLSFLQISILLSLLGFAASTQTIAYPSIVENNPSKLSGISLGIASIIIMLTAAFAQILFGVLIENPSVSQGAHGMKDYSTAVKIFPISFGLSLIVACFMKETHCKMQHGDETVMNEHLA